MALFDNEVYSRLSSGLDAVWKKQQVISNNIANSETPGFKAKKVSFEEVMEKAQDGESHPAVKARITENSATMARPDGNNVNVDAEELELWQTYAQYSALSSRYSGKMAALRYVINNTGK